MAWQDDDYITELEAKIKAAEARETALRASLAALRTAVEADYKCQRVDPRNVAEAHTWIALAIKNADAVLAAQEPDREPLAEGREHLTVSGKFRSDKFPLPDNIVPIDLTGRCRDLIAQAAERYGGEFGRDLKDALATKEGDDG